MAGYSGTPLVVKLGIVAGANVLVLGEPAEFQAALGALPRGATRTSVLRGRTLFDAAIVFVHTRVELVARFARVSARMTPEGGVWIAWPKKASKIATDVTEDVVRTVVLPTGFVDNKVCAIDATWSGLRCVLRRELRRQARP